MARFPLGKFLEIVLQASMAALLVKGLLFVLQVVVDALVEEAVARSAVMAARMWLFILMVWW